MGTKLWGGRFKDGLSNSAQQLSYSFDLDKRLYQQDIKVNRAHSKALVLAGVLSQTEGKSIDDCLIQIEEKFLKEVYVMPQTDEDIHSCIERLVTEKLGGLGKKLHTGKSRNDQVATDVRLFLKEEVTYFIDKIEQLLKTIVYLAEDNQGIYFPGFTHFQIAQPILLAHHFLAYYEKFKRDQARFKDLLARIDECPLGSAAFAGSNYNLDRDFLAKELGFSSVCQNSMDGVSARDFILEYFSVSAICMMHFSQISEELILWNSPALGWVEIGDAYTTGSSIMPQKKNPDIAELTRAKSGLFLSHFVGLHELLKGLPLTYNRDLQDDKLMLFQNVDIFHLVLTCYTEMLSTLVFKPKQIEVALQRGFSLATELADYLVGKGVPFRDAHEITGKIVRFAIQSEKGLEALSLEEYLDFSDKIEEDVFSCLTFESAVKRKKLLGGTAPNQIQYQLKRIKESHKWQ